MIPSNVDTRAFEKFLWGRTQAFFSGSLQTADKLSEFNF